MDKITRLLEKYLFPVRTPSLIIPVTICFIIIFVAVWVLSKLDLKYRRVKNCNYILLLYVPALFCGWAMYGISSDLIVGFSGLSVFFYLVQFIYNIKVNSSRGVNDKIVFVGTADIISAPLYTVWFGSAIITFFITFLIVLVAVEKIPMIKKWMDDSCLDKELLKHDHISLLPCLHITFVITLFWYLI